MRHPGERVIHPGEYIPKRRLIKDRRQKEYGFGPAFHDVVGKRFPAPARSEFGRIARQRRIIPALLEVAPCPTVEYGNGVFVVVSGDAKITSAEGITWTWVDSAPA